MGAPLGPGWVERAAFSGHTLLHHYCERKKKARFDQEHFCKNTYPQQFHRQTKIYDLTVGRGPLGIKFSATAKLNIPCRS